MLRKHKQFLLGFLIASLLFSSITVFADITEIKAFISDIKIALNGQLLELKDANGNKVKPIVYNGTTYLPVRALANAFGKEVDYNGKTNTVEIADKAITIIPAETKPIEEMPKEPVKEENKDIILHISESFEKDGFKLTLNRATKSNNVFKFHFYYENNTDKNVEGYSMIGAVSDNPKYQNIGGMLLYADTETPVSGGFPANSKDFVFVKIVDFKEFDCIEIMNTSVKWRIR